MKTITAEELDKKFDDGEDISEYVDWSKATRPGLALVHVDLDLPAGVLSDLDREAMRLGLTRQSLVTRWLKERLEAGRQGK